MDYEESAAVTVKDSGDPLAARLVVGILRAWRFADVSFAVLRNYEQLPTVAGNDLDVLVSSQDWKRAEHLMIIAATRAGFRLHNIVHRTLSSPRTYFFHRSSLAGQCQYHVDLHTNLNWRGFITLSAERVLSRRGTKENLFAPHIVDEGSVNLLTRLLYHGYVKEKYKPGILAAYRAEPEQARCTLAQPFGDRAAGELVTHVLAEDWASIEAETGRWRRLLVTRQLARRPWRTLSSMLSDARRLVRRFAVPPGLMVVMLGPDGCGKSSVGMGVMDALTPTFGKEKSKHLHWKPALFRRDRGDAGPVTDPHGKPPRSRSASLAYFAFHWFEFVLGAQLRLRPVLFRNGLVVVDRYFHDLFVDARRYRLDVPRWLLALGLPLGDEARSRHLPRCATRGAAAPQAGSPDAKRRLGSAKPTWNWRAPCRTHMWWTPRAPWKR